MCAALTHVPLTNLFAAKWRQLRALEQQGARLHATKRQSTNHARAPALTQGTNGAQARRKYRLSAWLRQGEVRSGLRAVSAASGSASAGAMPLQDGAPFRCHVTGWRPQLAHSAALSHPVSLWGQGPESVPPHQSGPQGRRACASLCHSSSHRARSPAGTAPAQPASSGREQTAASKAPASFRWRTVGPECS